MLVVAICRLTSWFRFDSLQPATSTRHMIEVIEKLLILQDRDQRISRVKAELAHIEPERAAFGLRAAAAQTASGQAKGRVKHLESDRKNLELEVETQKGLSAKYSLQQLQTRKNEEYKALANEIEHCNQEIVKIEDRQLELMEQAEAVQKEVVLLARAATDTRRLVDDHVAQLGARAENLSKDLAQLEANREELATAVDQGARSRYERLVRNKGQNVVVGVHHAVCGGCHMRLPPQLMVQCQAQKEIVTCSNCGRILYYTPDMDLAIAE